ncbi:MAG: hypothetical protein ACREEE_10750 [Dongiaceae bacterium]
MAKKNPLNLNALQLRTLTLFQEIARIAGRPAPDEPEGSILISSMPHPHGDHFHLGEAVVASRDASGLGNPAAWTALERKGLIQAMFPIAAVLTPAGVDYDTGMRDQILHRGNH